MLKIRLQRVGRLHEPIFRLVLTDSRNSTKSGKYLEMLGTFDARRGQNSKFDAEKITRWITAGARPSDTVHNLLVDKKIIAGKKLNKLPRKSAIKKEASAAEAKVEETESETSAMPAAEEAVA
jgi:small subunit ribosomal protein S16